VTFKELQNKIKKEKPLIHAITNPISINQCANTAISLGAMPIMAEHPNEVEEITRTARALLLNLGNITEVRMQSIKLSSKVAVKENIPIIIDAVGVACSRLRHNFLSEMLKDINPTLIKGNYSEIYALDNIEYRYLGVNAEPDLSDKTVVKSAMNLAKKHHSLILVTGKSDIVTDGERVFHIHNGHPRLSSVTGTGCMLGMLCSVFLSVHTDIQAVCMATAMMGICGEQASSHQGSGSFMTGLLDSLSLLTATDFEKALRMEEINIESI
jgi:hydroxyethylthiazole kinase